MHRISQRPPLLAARAGAVYSQLENAMDELVTYESDFFAWSQRQAGVLRDLARFDEAIARLKAAESDIGARGPAGLYLFGAVAWNEAQADSDVDVFIDPEPARRFGCDEFIAFYELLQERLGAEVGYTTRDGLHRLPPRVQVPWHS